MLAEVEPRLRRTLPAGHFAFAVLAFEKARNAAARGDISSAQKLVDQAVEIDEAAIKGGKQGSFYLPTVLVGRAEIELQGGHADLAVADTSRALDVLQKVMKPGTFSCVQGRAFLALGRALQAQSKLDQARTAFHSAVENLRSTIGPNHPETLHARQMSESRS
jgi:tetratricopeptide (TPR) repeat protein